ncbi:MAG: hypothetical protein LBI18_09790 [Planctomycetaceae bacterium]|jgi:hypothetical protein|nr:hypothetical protein [Planctomycetaceae bacterium]
MGDVALKVDDVVSMVGDVVSKVSDVVSKVGDVVSKVGDVVSKVGDVSPKHHVGDSRLAPVFGWQFVLPSGLESNCQPNTRTSCLTATQPFGERLPT